MQNLFTGLMSGVNAAISSYIAAFPATLEDFLGSLAVAVAIMILEWVCLGWNKSSIRKIALYSGSVRNDLWAFLLVGIGFAWPLAQLSLFGLPELVKNISLGWVHIIRPELGNSLFVALLWFIVYDFAMYWIHRWSHMIPALWALHSYHHSANEMTILTRFRFHPLEEALYTIVFAALLALLPVPKLYILVLMGASLVHTCLKHSGLAQNWGWVGRYILSSPAGHHIHHSKNEAHFGTNYATTFQFWDILFGTHHYPDQASVTGLQLGLSNDAGDRPVLICLLSHYLDFFKSFLPSTLRRQSS
ncbi:sterol desaturase family protein [Andreprevotia chitinilytica]|uniref:sterol desaturase family protein n=1 Tax=Andreprevotia chitinilytica TaxID=396808 RepID=UPI00068D1258|nr:sterol desaturase family protein [Andreprevotia chitinilytica]